MEKILGSMLAAIAGPHADAVVSFRDEIPGTEDCSYEVVAIVQSGPLAGYRVSLLFTAVSPATASRMAEHEDEEPS